MSKVDDLLLEGMVTQDPDDADKVIFNVPLRISKAAVNANAFELFAGEYGWTATIADPENPEGDSIANPESAIAKGVSVIRGFASEVLRAALFKDAEKTAKATATATYDALNL